MKINVCHECGHTCDVIVVRDSLIGDYGSITGGVDFYEELSECCHESVSEVKSDEMVCDCGMVYPVKLRQCPECKMENPEYEA